MKLELQLFPTMSSYYILFSLLLIPPATAQRPGTECPADCGGVEIPYPFGIGSGCPIDPSFNILCNHSINPPKPFIVSDQYSQFEVVRIDVNVSQVRVKYPHLAQGCFSTEVSEADRNTTLYGSDIDIDLSATPYTLSEKNWITVVGCDDFVRINGIDSNVFAGCTSICVDNHTAGTCPDRVSSGNGCCRSSISRGTTRLNFSFTDMHEHSRDELKHRLFRCSYAFVGERQNDSFSYAVRGLNDSSTFLSEYPNATNTQWVLDWWIVNQTCVNGTCNKTTDCNDLNHGGIGHKCHCRNGYQGNPYLSGHGGCQDINECSEPSQHDCITSGHCKNTEGSYFCSCPKGYIGDGKKNGSGCYLSTTINVFIGVASGIGFMLLLAMCYWLYSTYQRINEKTRRKSFFRRNGGLLLQQQTNGVMFGKNNLFSAKELEKATDHFNEARVLGQGAQGTVYKGILSDGRIVAIKKAKLLDEHQLEQFINEMAVLSQINHKHIVKLLGCCLETEVPLLVYEFMPNGTLFSLIHDPGVELVVTWNMRLKIATDIAEAIAYLHSASSIPIYHRDIKSSNVLLDEKYVVKVSDFGGSRLVSVDQTHVTTRVMGTFGYIDPEYFESGQFTEKSDVYSFGVVLVELLTGEKPGSLNRDYAEGGLVTHFLTSIEGKNVENILDNQVSQGSREDVMVVTKLAKRCLNSRGKLRPTMKAVARELGNLRKAQMGLLVGEDEEDHHDDIIRDCNETRLTMLRDFEYTWTSSSNSLPSSPTHPFIKDRV